MPSSKNKKDRGFLVPIDLLAISIAWSLYYWMRIRSGWMSYSMEPEFWVPMLVIAAFWLLVFFLFGLYRSWYAQSRFDEFAALFKSTTFGVLVLFFAIFIDDRGVGSPVHARLLILLYWVLILLSVSTGRVLLHSFQRKLLESGVGLP